MERKNRDIDIYLYIGFVILLVLYGIYIRSTCEELGCVVIIFPILGIMIATGIEFLISLYIYIQNKNISAARSITLAITGVITALILVMIFISYIN